MVYVYKKAPTYQPHGWRETDRKQYQNFSTFEDKIQIYKNKKLGLVLNFFEITYSNILLFTNAASQIE